MALPRENRYPPETRLLLAACSDQPDVVDTRGVDWESLLATAVRHRIAPLLYRYWKAHPDRLPARSLAAFRKEYAVAAATNLRQMHWLQIVLRKFAEQSIPVMLLKGAALLRTVYSDPALRTMDDVDLLLHREDLPRAAEALRSCGLVPVRPGFEEHYEKNHHHWEPYKSPDTSIVVEMHHDLVPPANSVTVDIDGVWRRAVPAPGGGPPVLVPSTADMLLHDCIHNSSHGIFYPLRSLYDLSEMVRRSAATVDWNQLAEIARSWNAAREAFCLFALTEQLLRPGFPAAALRQLRQAARFRLGEERLLLRLARGIVAPAWSDRRIPNWLTKDLWNIAIAPSAMPIKACQTGVILWRNLLHSAALAKPELSPFQVRCYALLCHPFGVFRRRLLPPAGRVSHGNTSC